MRPKSRVPKGISRLWRHVDNNDLFDALFDDDDIDIPFDGEEVDPDEPKFEAVLLSTKGLPIYTVDKEAKQSAEFALSHPVNTVYEILRYDVEVEKISGIRKVYTELLDTECELIFTENTAMLSDGERAQNILVRHGDVHYRSEGDSERFPIYCLAVVDDINLPLLKNEKTIKEKAKMAKSMSELSKPQREHIRRMAARPEYDESTETFEDGYVPIRDEGALLAMYKACKKTYPPSVRNRIETLISQLEGAAGGDRNDILNQLSFVIGIDTSTNARPHRSYDEHMAILDKHIYGCQELKESVVEFIIAMQMSGASYFTLLIVGPPGVGKTSVCDAIAECISSPIVNIDCSGVDSVTMSGLVKSYSGAKAGKVMDGLLEMGRTDLIVRFDELDKMCSSKDDPYGALTKPLGPQRKYYDEYVASDTDVSATKFIATANDISKIPGYILSRFEDNIIFIDPYTEDEKVAIALNHIIPKRLKEFNISEGDCVFKEDALRLIIGDYCSDDGVRELAGNIKKLMFKVMTECNRGIISMPVTIDCDYVRGHLNSKRNDSNMSKIGFI